MRSSLEPDYEEFSVRSSHQFQASASSSSEVEVGETWSNLCELPASWDFSCFPSPEDVKPVFGVPDSHELGWPDGYDGCFMDPDCWHSTQMSLEFGNDGNVVIADGYPATSFVPVQSWTTLNYQHQFYGPSTIFA